MANSEPRLNAASKGPAIHNAALFLAGGAAASVLCALFASQGNYLASALTAVAIIAVLAVIALQVSVETLLILWFVATPLASFYGRIPWDRSIITFNRAFFLLAIAIVAIRAAGTPDVRFKVSGFELAWAALCLIAMASAGLKADDPAGAARLVVDSFFLPLVAFHLASHHFNIKGRGAALLGAAIVLAILLAGIGAAELLSGRDLFQYTGAALVRGRETRINGPFASDSSYAGICLLLLVFMIEAPRVLSVRMDRSGRVARVIASLCLFAGTLLPLFRGIAIAMIACWAIMWLGGRKASARQSAGARQSIRTSSRAGLLLLIPLLVVIAWTAGVLDLSRLSSRLANPRNVLVRIAAWSDSGRALLNNPWSGVGLGNYQAYFYANRNRDLDTVASDFEVKAVDSPHSNFLWIGAELGFPALLIYCTAFGVLVVQSWRGLRSKFETGRAAAICSLALLAAYLIPGLELTSGYYSDLNLYFFLLLGLMANRFAVEPIQRNAEQV